MFDESKSLKTLDLNNVPNTGHTSADYIVCLSCLQLNRLLRKQGGMNCGGLIYGMQYRCSYSNFNEYFLV